MKKLLSLAILIIFLVISCVQTYAAEVEAYYSDKTYNCLVEGKTAVGDASKYISILLLGESEDDIGHIGMTKVNSDGTYSYKFKFSGDINQYKLMLKMQDEDITGSVINAVASGTDIIRLEADFYNENGEKLDLKTDRTVMVKAKLNNRLGDSGNCTIFSGFYSSNGTLLDVVTLYDGVISYEASGKNIESPLLEVPEKTESIEIFAWENTMNIKPLHKQVNVDGGYGACLYVSANNGDDANAGTIDAPLKTIGAAKEAVRNIKNTIGLPYGGVNVYLREGKYYIEKTVDFTTADAGTAEAPINYCSYKNEKAILTGGVYLSGSDFHTVTASDAMYSRLPSGAASNIVAINLGAFGITNYGEPKVNGCSFTYQDPMGIEVFVDNRPCYLSRWPNVDSDNYNQYVYTKALVTNANSLDSGTSGNKPVIKVDGNTSARLSRWASLTDEVLCNGWYNYKYNSNAFFVDSFSSGDNQITLSKATPGGFSSTDKFYFYNVLEELDTPGEYYIDRTNGVLYMYRPNGFTAASSIGLSMQVYSANNIYNMMTLYNGADYINFKGITFELSRSRFVHVKFSKNINFTDCTFRNNSAEALWIGDMFKLNGVEYRFGELGNTGFEVKTKNVSITDCSFENNGGGGLCIYGGDRNKLERANYTVSNCYFTNCDRLRYNYAPAISALGVGMSITNCHISNMSGMGMEIGGNDIDVAYNDFDNLSREAYDSAMLYVQRNVMGTYIHNNYFHDVPDVTRDNDSIYAYGHYVGASSPVFVPFRVGVYIDGFQLGGNVYSNVFKNVPVGVRMCAYDQTMTGNVFIDVYTALSSNVCMNVYQAYENNSTINFTDSSTKDLGLLGYDDINTYWKIKIPQAFTLRNSLAQRATNTGLFVADPTINAGDNIIYFSRLDNFYNNNIKSLSDSEKLSKLYTGLSYMIRGGSNVDNVIITDVNPGFANFDGGDYSLLPYATLRSIPKLLNIDMSKIGLTE